MSFMSGRGGKECFLVGDEFYQPQKQARDLLHEKISYLPSTKGHQPRLVELVITFDLTQVRLLPLSCSTPRDVAADPVDISSTLPPRHQTRPTRSASFSLLLRWLTTVSVSSAALLE